MKNIYSLSLRELSDSLSLDHADTKVAIARVASYAIGGNLDEDSSFEIYCALANYGPANDFNGERSAARQMMTKWESEVLTPALLLVSKIKKSRQS